MRIWETADVVLSLTIVHAAWNTGEFLVRMNKKTASYT
jgi:hypothetical protein